MRLGSSVVLEEMVMGQLSLPIAIFRASWPLVARTSVVERLGDFPSSLHGVSEREDDAER